MESSSSARDLAARPQAVQSFFPGASNFGINGGQFNAIAGDYVVHHNDPVEIQNLFAQFLQSAMMRRTIAQMVGFSRENGITIIDAFGEKLVFPLSIMAQYSDIHDNLSKHFRFKLGEAQVAEQRYCLVRESDGGLVEPEGWETMREGGTALVMCMLIQKVWVYTESVKNACPKCGRTRLGTMREGGFLICRRCGKSFTHFNWAESRLGNPPVNADRNVDAFKHVRKSFVWPAFISFPKISFPPKIERKEWDKAIRREESRFEEITD